MGCIQSTPAADPVAATIESKSNAVSDVPDIQDVEERVVAKVLGRPLIVDYSIDDNGIVMYHIEVNGTVVNKRFSDFKAFHASLLSVFPLLPPLPPSGLWTALKRGDPVLIQERRARFDDILSVAPPDHVAAFLAIPVDDSRPEREVYRDPVPAGGSKGPSPRGDLPGAVQTVLPVAA